MSKSRWSGILDNPKIKAQIDAKLRLQGINGVEELNRPTSRNANSKASSGRQGNIASQTFARETKSTPQSARIRAVKQKLMEGGRLDSLSVDEAKGTLTVIFKGAALIGMNTMVRVHDAQSTGVKRAWKERVRALRLTHTAEFKRWRDSIQYPLLIEEVYMTEESSRLDVESVAAGCKPVIDAFVTEGFIEDDGPDFVAQPLAYTERAATGSLVIRFSPSPRPWGMISDQLIATARSS